MKTVLLTIKNVFGTGSTIASYFALLIALYQIGFIDTEMIQNEFWEMIDYFDKLLKKIILTHFSDFLNHQPKMSVKTFYL